MTTAYIDSIINPGDYIYAYDYLLTPDLKLYVKHKNDNYQNDILNIISNAEKDKDITGAETFVYKDTDGTLKLINIDCISNMIYNRIKESLTSKYDLLLDENIKNVSSNIETITSSILKLNARIENIAKFEIDSDMFAITDETKVISSIEDINNIINTEETDIIISSDDSISYFTKKAAKTFKNISF